MAIKAATSFSLKDQLFNADSVAELTAGIKHAHAQFRRAKFEQEAIAGFAERELKQRILWLAKVLTKALPNDFDQILKILTAALPPPLDPAKSDGDFGKFIWAVPAEISARRR